MAVPVYKRKWFKAGIAVIAVGIFTFMYASFQHDKYAKLYPHIVEDKLELTAEMLQQDAPEPIEEQLARKLTKEEQKKETAARMVYGLSGAYKLIGIVFFILGIIIMLASFKEPQVPEMEDIPEGDEDEEQKAQE